MKIAVQKKSLVMDTKSYTLTDILEEVNEDVQLLIHLGCSDLKKKHFSVEYGKKILSYGTCSRRLMSNGVQHYTIYINKDFLRVGKAENVHNTIMHECIHCVDGCMNHGAKWQAIAAKVNSRFDFTPISRTGTDPNYKNVIESKYHYFATCTKCHQTSKWIRKGSIFQACKDGVAICPCGNNRFICEEK